LRLVAPHAPPLGAALLRRQALAEVGGFPEALSFAGDENLLLRIAGMHENTRASRGRFVVAPSATPLYFEREAAPPGSPLWKTSFAREHLDNLMIARALLRDHQLGMLTLEETREIAKLCTESLRDLERYDRRAFKQCSRLLRENRPRPHCTDVGTAPVPVAARFGTCGGKGGNQGGRVEGSGGAELSSNVAH